MTSLARTCAAGLALLATLAGVSPLRAADATQACRVAGIKHEVRCGKVTRLLDPARPDGPKIEVHYVVVPAMARRKLPDPVFLLAGGPGQSAIAVAPNLLGLFARLNNRRDIVFVDQRGTGKSAPLECEDTRHAPLAELAAIDRQVARVLECKGKLLALPHVKQESDLRFFTTTLAMQDLEAVRAQLGATRINLVGASYGTRAALEYLRQFPQGVRRAVLDGVAPPDMNLPASMSPDSQAALDALIAACTEEAACVKAYPSLREDWTALLKSLPRSTTVLHPLNGNRESLVLTRELLIGLVRGPLYSPALAAALPSAISEAAQGRFDALGGLAAMLGTRRAGQLAMGMHFSVVCAEDMSQPGPPLEAPGVDFGRDFERLYERVCAQWPRGAVPKGFAEVPKFAQPVLLLSGGLDPVTPPRHGERIARALGPAAQHVIVPNAGHGVMGIGCMRDVVFRFLDAAEDAQPGPVDAACVRAIPRPLTFMPLAGGRDVPK
jgi:pimeloyl-ACP methyl ester carboxylesterase